MLLICCHFEYLVLVFYIFSFVRAAKSFSNTFGVNEPRHSQLWSTEHPQSKQPFLCKPHPTEDVTVSPSQNVSEELRHLVQM